MELVSVTLGVNGGCASSLGDGEGLRFLYLYHGPCTYGLCDVLLSLLGALPLPDPPAGGGIGAPGESTSMGTTGEAPISLLIISVIPPPGSLAAGLENVS